MGMLDDIVQDARRTVPAGMVLRRSAVDTTMPIETDDTPEPADDGALTVYRLQKEGGSNPPKASPGSYPSDDTGMQAGRPEGVAVVNHGALRPDRKVIDRLETGQDRLLEMQSDVSGVTASRVPEDPGPSLMNAGPVSAGSVSPSWYVGHWPAAAKSRSDSVAPTTDHSHAVTPVKPSEGYQASDSRNKLSTERRREDGLDAPSEDLSRASQAGGPGLHDALMRAAQATRAQMAQLAQAPQHARVADRAQPPAAATGLSAGQTAFGEASALAGVPQLSMPGSMPEHQSSVTSPTAQKVRPNGPAQMAQPSTATMASPPPGAEAQTASAPRHARLATPLAGGMDQRARTGADQAPRLSIGRIEVVVLAPAAEPASTGTPAFDSAAWLSKHYLRRL